MHMPNQSPQYVPSHCWKLDILRWYPTWQPHSKDLNSFTSITIASCSHFILLSVCIIKMFKSVIIYLYINLLKHVTPSPKKPPVTLHAQLKPPRVLLQVAFLWQLCISSTHSSKSEKNIRVAMIAIFILTLYQHISFFLYHKRNQHDRSNYMIHLY